VARCNVDLPAVCSTRRCGLSDPAGSPVQPVHAGPGQSRAGRAAGSRCCGALASPAIWATRGGAGALRSLAFPLQAPGAQPGREV